MASVKSILNCIGVDTSGTVSILEHMFGFIRRRVPNDPCSTATSQVSLLNQVRSLKESHIHLNIIRVGIDILLILRSIESTMRFIRLATYSIPRT